MIDIDFPNPREESSIIKIIGVGGAGCNAVNQMFKMDVEGVDFVICNTDSQALKASPVPLKIQLGTNLTEGRGAGNDPEKGRQAAIENLSDIEKILDDNAKMVFITAGMGGGTGTGAAPVIAKAAKEKDILTIAIVSIPFKIEGKTRVDQAKKGIEEIKQYVDALLVINNEKLKELYEEQKFSIAFSKADDILATAAVGIAEIITVHGYINVDFEDVKTVMSNSGVALMGSAQASGEDRGLKAVESALESPLLKDNDIKGAEKILLNIMSARGEYEIMMAEFEKITDFLQKKAGSNANIIWGTGLNDSLEDQISVTVIATGFKTFSGMYEDEKMKKIHIPLGNNLFDHLENEHEESEDNKRIEIDPSVEGGQRTFEFDVQHENDNKNSENDIETSDAEDKPDKNKDNFLYVSDIKKLNEAEYLDELENESAISRKMKRSSQDHDSSENDN